MSEFETTQVERMRQGLARLDVLWRKEIVPPPNPSTIMSIRNPNFPLWALKRDGYVAGSDTLVVGDEPAETLRISGNWNHRGPIFVINDGVILVKGGHMVLEGDLWILQNGKVIIDSSIFEVPQEYPYHHSAIIVHSGSMILSNSTTYFYNFTYGIALSDSAIFHEENVSNGGFITFAAFGEAPTFVAENTRRVGEIVVGRTGSYTVRNSDTVLLWLRSPPRCTLNLSLPTSDTVFSFSMDSTAPGMSGIEYSLTIDSSTGIVWGLMDEDSSYTIISSSNLAAIGLFFGDHDSMEVSGIVGNTHLSHYVFPLSDRHLELNDVYLHTVSLYALDSSHLQVGGSILGEVLSMYDSHVELENTFVDGSGGYLGSQGNSINLISFSSLNGDLKSTENSILIFAYSMQGGLASGVVAADRSIMIIAQSELQEYPRLYDGAFAWVTTIRCDRVLPIGTNVPIEGDAYAEAGPLGSFLSFSHYSLHYRSLEDSTWYSIAENVPESVKEGILGTWNTADLPPGSYLLKLTTFLNTGDSLPVVRLVNLAPLSVWERGKSPPPFTLTEDGIFLKYRGKIYNPAGRIVGEGKGPIKLPPGVFILEVEGKIYRIALPRF
ncbi:MAG: hypothetical protein GXO39_04655 [Thermotogae bacterium]|nr:hypothetical protein [Thermotogota bacterium]